MKILKCKNHKTGRNGNLEIRDGSFWLTTVTYCTGLPQAKLIGRTERCAKRWMSRKGWVVVPLKPENMDIMRRPKD